MHDVAVAGRAGFATDADRTPPAPPPAPVSVPRHYAAVAAAAADALHDHRVGIVADA